MTRPAPPSPPQKLRRTLTLPLLVFYGVGVTVGAGIFALIGEILALAGDAAPMAFLLAGLIAGATGVSYAVLVGVFPLAGGDAVFVSRGLGPALGRLSGIAVSVVGIISSAVIALAFAGYAGTLLPFPEAVSSPVLVTTVVALLAAVAIRGVRESVLLAAAITILEVGTLLVVIVAGLPALANLPPPSALVGFDSEAGVLAGFAPVIAGAFIAFFAFVGFEDIENMAEETVAPERTAPRAILWTLGVTVVVYVALALVAVSAPGRETIAGSAAPLAILFEQLTGIGRAPLAAMAAIAMINGILVQILMASRTLYGMANEGLLPAWFGAVDPSRRTPRRATLAVTALIVLLALAFPLVGLAQATSLIVLAVFALVNLSLFRLGGSGDYPQLRPWRWWGFAGAILCAVIPVFQLWAGAFATHH